MQERNCYSTNPPTRCKNFTSLLLHSQAPATCPYPEPDQFSPSFPQPHFLKINSNINIPYILSLSSDLFPQVSHQNSAFTSTVPPIRATYPARFILLDLITRIISGEEYRSLIYSLCSFLHSPVTSFLLGSNIFLSTLFSNTLSLCFSLNVSYQVSHPYQTTRKIIVL